MTENEGALFRQFCDRVASPRSGSEYLDAQSKICGASQLELLVQAISRFEAQTGKHIRYLNLSFTSLDDHSMELLLPLLPYVENLKLCHNFVGDEGATTLARALAGRPTGGPPLELDLSENPIGERGARAFVEHCPWLARDIGLDYCRVPFPVLRAIYASGGSGPTAAATSVPAAAIEGGRPPEDHPMAPGACCMPQIKRLRHASPTSPVDRGRGGDPGSRVLESYSLLPEREHLPRPPLNGGPSSRTALGSPPIRTAPPGLTSTPGCPAAPGTAASPAAAAGWLENCGALVGALEGLLDQARQLRAQANSWLAASYPASPPSSPGTRDILSEAAKARVGHLFQTLALSKPVGPTGQTSGAASGNSPPSGESSGGSLPAAGPQLLEAAPVLQRRLEGIEAAKEAAVAREAYEEAARLRALVAPIYAEAERLAQLRSDIRQAAAAEDFQAAAEYKATSEHCRQQVAEMLLALPRCPADGGPDAQQHPTSAGSSSQPRPRPQSPP
ncbi:hypothetical protein PAPYR_3885 [Paratrimastix pyriformis]|uniref:Uncharacterized protein n=1 Tax=Paratrimastix pyriformis TaxID=342808 RepID=A0ABQ8URJ8_9EUKA|nr:hypothetical protein PAPYR_3885 [Paratrimastix pyriformis]